LAQGLLPSRHTPRIVGWPDEERSTMVAWHRAGVSGAVSGMAISVFNVALVVLREPRARARSMRPTFTLSRARGASRPAHQADRCA